MLNTCKRNIAIAVEANPTGCLSALSSFTPSESPPPPDADLCQKKATLPFALSAPGMASLEVPVVHSAAPGRPEGGEVVQVGDLGRHVSCDRPRGRRGVVARTVIGNGERVEQPGGIDKEWKVI